MYQNKTLDQIVGEAYRDKVMNGEPMDAGIQRFNAAAETDPAFRAAAVKELSAAENFMKSSRSGSCVLTAFSAEFLRQAVDQMPPLKEREQDSVDAPKKKMTRTAEEFARFMSGEDV